MVQEQKLDFLCVQETKMGVVDRLICAQLWDCDDFSGCLSPPMGLLGVC